jgi:hypothetical protein
MKALISVIKGRTSLTPFWWDFLIRIKRKIIAYRICRNFLNSNYLFT